MLVVEQLQQYLPLQTYQEHKHRKCPKCFVYQEVTFMNVTSAKTAKLQLEKYNLASKTTSAHQCFSTWHLMDHNNVYWALLFKLHITVRRKSANKAFSRHTAGRTRQHWKLVNQLLLQRCRLWCGIGSGNTDICNLLLAMFLDLDLSENKYWNKCWE